MTEPTKTTSNTTSKKKPSPKNTPAHKDTLTPKDLIVKEVLLAIIQGGTNLTDNLLLNKATSLTELYLKRCEGEL